ncbi:hypothetical protein ABT009_37075 [Streptomyces sp. NPDC002896]|uniref:alcohol dehydrogenase catalytic domain-containing protein n=1 Tax=Streptomyces sp. NPDC002896 TaxID=3154438 RepID=UPI00331A1AEC
MDAAGMVEQVGEGVDTDLSAGDHVMAIALVSGTHGAYAEHLVVPAESVVRVPAGATDIEAATLPMSGLTARMALDLLELPAGAARPGCPADAAERRPGGRTPNPPAERPGGWPARARVA